VGPGDGVSGFGDGARGLGVGRRFFFSSRGRHTRFSRDWSSDVCSSDLVALSLTSVVGAGVALAVYVTGDFESTTTFRAEEASSGALAVDTPAPSLWGTLLVLGTPASPLIADGPV